MCSQTAQQGEAPGFICFPFSSRRMDPESTPTSPVGDCTVVEQNPKYQRSLRSLNVLATRFVMLLQEAEGGVLDIKDVSELTYSNKH